MNNKGFTLIELIAVIVILVSISLVAIPSISSSIERTKNDQKEAKIELIKSSAELYFSDHINDQCVSVSELIEAGYITRKSVLDPYNNEEILSGSVNRTFAYSEINECVS